MFPEDRKIKKKLNWNNKRSQKTLYHNSIRCIRCGFRYVLQKMLYHNSIPYGFRYVDTRDVWNLLQLS